MKLTPKLPLLCLILAVIIPSARAGFGDLVKMASPSAEGSAPTLSAADFSSLLEQTTGNVLAARLVFLDAQADLSGALGLNTASMVEASAGLRALEGSTASTSEKIKALKASSKKTEDAKKSFSEALAKSDNLSDEAKERFSKGTVKFLEGVLLEKKQIETVVKLVQQGKALSASANMLEKAKLLLMVKPATELASMVPGDVKEGFTTFGQITAFAKKQNVTVPSQESMDSELGSIDSKK